MRSKRKQGRNRLPIGLLALVAIIAGPSSPVRAKGETTSSATGPWERAGPRGGFSALSENGRIAGIQFVGPPATEPWALLAGASSGGLWEFSPNLYGIWVPLGDKLPNPSVRALNVNPNDLHDIVVITGDPGRYAGGGGYYTRDGGTTWTESSFTYDPPRYGYRILRNPGTLTVLVAATENALYRSTDNGASWQSMLSGRVTDVVRDPSSPLVLYCVKSTSGVYKSTDDGLHWTHLPSPVLPSGASWDRASLAICRDAPQNLVVMVEDDNYLRGVYKTTNGGSSWQDISGSLLGDDTDPDALADNFGGNQAYHAQAIAFRPDDPSEIFLGVADIARTTDGGATWLQGEGPSGIPKGHGDLQQLHFAPDFDSYTGDDNLWICNDGGVYRHDLQTGVTHPWNGTADSPASLQVSQIYHLDADRNVRVIGMQDCGIALSANSGANWTSLFNADGGDVEITDPYAGDVWYAEWGRDGTAVGHIHKHPHGGSSTDTGNPGENDPQLFYDRFSGKMFSHADLDASHSRIIVSDVSSPSWSNVVTVPYGINDVVGSYVNGKVILARYGGSGAGTISVHQKSGSTWDTRQVTVAPAGETVQTLYTSPEWPCEAWAGLHGDPGEPKLLHTHDCWQTWEDVSGDLPTSVERIRAIVQTPFHSGELYVGTETGVYRTQDGGETWQEFQDGLPRVRVTDLRYIIDPDHGGNDELVAATFGHGVWRRPLAGTPIVYVDQTYSGPENGDWERPFHTITEGLEAIEDTHIVGVRGGTYTEPSLVDLTWQNIVTAYENAVFINP
jgi:photosystem II stability/assembly factor-like uncharacterized protein